LVVEQPVAAAGLNTSRIALQRSPVSLDYLAADLALIRLTIPAHPPL
jgi:hypothetical protein